MPITIQLPPEAERRLTELAIQTGRDVDFYLIEIVQRGLEAVGYLYMDGERLYSDSQKWTIVRRADEQCE